MSQQKKLPITPAVPDKQIARSESPNRYMDLCPAWRFSRLDDDGEWGWKKIGRDRWEKKVLPKLRSFESMKWSEILKPSGDSKSGSKYHPLAVTEKVLTPEALKRLQELRIATDTLFSFAISNKERIIGVRQENNIDLIWYDANHEVAKTSRN